MARYGRNNGQCCWSNVLPELQPVVDWLEDNYIGRLNRNGSRRRPIFPVAMLNMYDRTINGLDRTNGNAEAAHRRLQSVLQMDHPSIWTLICSLRQVQKERDILYEQMMAGHAPTAKWWQRVLSQIAGAADADCLNNKRLLLFCYSCVNLLRFLLQEYYKKIRRYGNRKGCPVSFLTERYVLN